MPEFTPQQIADYRLNQQINRMLDEHERQFAEKPTPPPPVPAPSPVKALIVKVKKKPGPKPKPKPEVKPERSSDEICPVCQKRLVYCHCKQSHEPTPPTQCRD